MQIRAHSAGMRKISSQQSLGEVESYIKQKISHAYHIYRCISTRILETLGESSSFSRWFWNDTAEKLNWEQCRSEKRRFASELNSKLLLEAFSRSSAISSIEVRVQSCVQFASSESMPDERLPLAVKVNNSSGTSSVEKSSPGFSIMKTLDVAWG